MKKCRTKYSLEFKTFAVLLSKKSGILPASQDLDVSSSNLYHWRKIYKNGKLTSEQINVNDSMGKEIARLRKEIKDICLERDIVKKAPGIFTKKDG